MKLLLILIVLIISSCSTKTEEPPRKITILSEEESNKILKKIKIDSSTSLSDIKKGLDSKDKKKTKVAVNKFIIRTDKGKGIKVGTNTYKNLEENLKKKKVKETVKIKETLDNLEFLKYKTDAVKKFDKENNLTNKSTKSIDIHISDKIRAMFKPIINNFSLRHLKFDNEGNEIMLDTISLSYINKEKKKKIDLETMPYNNTVIDFTKKKQKDFFYKKYKLDNITLHLSVNYKLRLVNGAFNYLGYSWVILGENIEDISNVVDVIRNINFNLFMELKKKYEEK